MSSVEVKIIGREETEIYITGLRPKVLAGQRAAVRELGIEVKEIMKEFMPERTGELKRSVVVEFLPDGVAIYPTAPYAAAVETGIKASLGRYIPAIEKRFSKATISRRPTTVGMHPGFVGFRYVEKTLEVLPQRIPEFLERIKVE